MTKLATISLDIDTFYREIGNCVKAEREDLGFTQFELAQEVGVTRTSIVNIEAGRQRAPLHTLYAIAGALGISISCLLPNNTQ